MIRAPIAAPHALAIASKSSASLPGMKCWTPSISAPNATHPMNDAAARPVESVQSAAMSK
jgi:hypothetical protein